MNCRKCKKPLPDGAVFCAFCGMRQEKQRGAKSRANGQGQAYRRGKTWTAKVTIGWDGTKRLVRTKGGFRTKTDALSYIQQLKNDPAVRRVPLLTDYWRTYSTSDMDRLSDSKRQAYEIAWNKLGKLALRPVDSITVSDLQVVVRETCPTYYPARDVKSLLSHLFRLAAVDGFASKDAPSLISLPKLTSTEREPFTEEEVTLLWQSYPTDPNAAIPLIMIYTGMMPGEMRRLTGQMIDLDRRQIVGVGIKTTTRKKVSVVLPDAICPVLEDLQTDGLIYPITETAFYDRYYAALSKAGITRHLTPYSCRHTTATVHAIREGMPPQLLTRIMRWSTSRMADRYVHPSDQAALDAVKEMR